MVRTVGVDVGGTFTDVVVYDGDSIDGRKLPTTVDQSVAVIRALSNAGVDAASHFLHGTTAGTNALLEERGALTALVTSRGFEDLIEIGRQARPSLYDSFVDRPAPLVQRSLRFGFDGNLAGLRAALDAVGPDAVAVALLRSYDDPAEELELADALAEGYGPVSVGARVSPLFREYERIATTVLNAYLTPEIAGYLGRIDDSVAAGRRLVMTSSGGLLPFASAKGYAGRLVLSGPAAGVVAATSLGLAHGHESVISFDMGGTSTDVCRITGNRSVGIRGRDGTGWVNRVRSLPVKTIGAGGGSLVWVDDGGALRVGPQSAGSVPGPAAYGQGGNLATVTDANVVLGRIPVDRPLGGSVDIDGSKARSAVDLIGSVLGLGTERTAAGIIEVVDTHMERALRSVSVEEGVDPRQSVLVAFGGAGGLHASRLARRLGMTRTLIPPLSGVFSALGLLLARPSSDATRTVMLEEGSALLGGAVDAIVADARETFSKDHGLAGLEIELRGDVRYSGQSHELSVPLTGNWEDIRRFFESEHRARFGFLREDQPVELVNVEAEVTGRAPLGWGDLPDLKPMAPPIPSRTISTVGARGLDIDVWERTGLPPGFETHGPAIIVESDCAIWLEPDDRLAVHDDGTLEIGL